MKQKNRTKQKPRKLRANRRIEKGPGALQRAWTQMAGLGRTLRSGTLVLLGSVLFLAGKLKGIPVKKRLAPAGAFAWKQIRSIEVQKGLASIARGIAFIVSLLVRAGKACFSKEVRRSTVAFVQDAGPKLRATDWRKSPAKVLRFFDPSVVRLEAPGRFTIHTVLMSVVFVSLAVCAVTVAARSAGQQGGVTRTVDTGAWLDEAPPEESNGDDLDGAPEAVVEETASPAKPKRSKKPQNGKLPENFYDPLYIFMEYPAPEVNVYPLADPPGIVVDLPGTLEPAGSPVDMVGEDSRILRIKRTRTTDGIRYILWLSTKISRIGSHNEGNVITLNPLRG